MEKIIKILLPFLLTVFAEHVSAQRFFYIEDSPVTRSLLNESFKKACQYTTKSALASDYIVSTDVSLQPESNTMTVQLIMKDSVTLKTLFQTNEVYTMEKANSNKRLFVSMAIRTFIEKNIPQVVQYSKMDHSSSEMNWLKPRKDKT